MAPLFLGALATLAAPSAAQTVYSTDFTDLTGWTTSTSAPGFEWRADATPAASTACNAAPFRSAPACLNFNDGTTFAQGVVSVVGVATSPLISLDPQQALAYASFWYSVDHEPGCSFDSTAVQVVSATGAVLSWRCIPAQTAPADCTWQYAEVAIDPSWGDVHIRFTTSAVDSQMNSGRGPYIDDLVVAYGCGGDAEVVCLGNQSGAYPSGMGVYGGSRLEADGSPSIAGGTLTVTATRMEGPGFALLLGAPTAASQPYPALGHGLLCIDAATARRLTIAPVSAASASASWTLPLGTPASPLAGVAPGDSVVLQGYYRDRAVSNLTDAVRVRFCH